MQSLCQIHVVGIVRDTPKLMDSKSGKWTKVKLKVDPDLFDANSIEIIAFDTESAEMLVNHCHRGMIIDVVGKPGVGYYKTKDNIGIKTIEIYASSIKYVDSANELPEVDSKINFIDFPTEKATNISKDNIQKEVPW